MSDELDAMQSENFVPVQNESPEQTAPSVEADAAETPVKKRRGRPPKKRTDAETEGDVAAMESSKEEASVPVQAEFGAKSAARGTASFGGGDEPDFGDDADYAPASVQHVDSFEQGSRDGLKVISLFIRRYYASFF